MKKTITLFSAIAIAVLPFAASAHQHESFEINGETYDFTVGSLNEPVTVDDKTGVDLRVSLAGHEAMPANDHHAAGGAVTGLEQTLKVELIAGDKKKTLDLSPVYNTPGSYKAAFYPTVATTLSYRVFGTINETDFDYTFTCNPAGHTVAPEDKTRVEVSDKVTRTLKTGAFGCPTEKAPMGFPENSADVVSLTGSTQSASFVGWGAAAIALLALALAFTRRRS